MTNTVCDHFYIVPCNTVWLNGFIFKMLDSAPWTCNISFFFISIPFFSCYTWCFSVERWINSLCKTNYLKCFSFKKTIHFTKKEILPDFQGISYLYFTISWDICVLYMYLSTINCIGFKFMKVKRSCQHNQNSDSPSWFKIMFRIGLK